eukprot:scaffold60340_cov32-Tisochrysis_lutea.AAC.1
MAASSPPRPSAAMACGGCRSRALRRLWHRRSVSWRVPALVRTQLLRKCGLPGVPHILQQCARKACLLDPCAGWQSVGATHTARSGRATRRAVLALACPNGAGFVPCGCGGLACLVHRGHVPPIRRGELASGVVIDRDALHQIKETLVAPPSARRRRRRWR